MSDFGGGELIPLAVETWVIAIISLVPAGFPSARAFIQSKRHWSLTGYFKQWKGVGWYSFYNSTSFTFSLRFILFIAPITVWYYFIYLLIYLFHHKNIFPNEVLTCLIQVKPDSGGIRTSIENADKIKFSALQAESFGISIDVNAGGAYSVQHTLYSD